MDVGGWLRSLGLEEYEKAFRENKVDAAVLPKLTVGTRRPGGFARGYLGLSEVRRGDRAALPGVRGEVHEGRGPGVFRVSDFARSIYSRPLIAGPLMRRGVLGQRRLLKW